MADLRWQPLYSKHVSQAAFDPDEGLHVIFNDGSHWIYPEADAEVFKLLMGPGSAGRIMHTVVKPLYSEGAHRVS